MAANFAAAPVGTVSAAQIRLGSFPLFGKQHHEALLRRREVSPRRPFVQSVANADRRERLIPHYRTQESTSVFLGELAKGRCKLVNRFARDRGGHGVRVSGGSPEESQGALRKLLLSEDLREAAELHSTAHVLLHPQQIRYHGGSRKAKECNPVALTFDGYVRDSPEKTHANHLNNVA